MLAASKSIPAHTQLLAIAWLRWRQLVNNFRRRQASRPKILILLLIILLRVFMAAVLALVSVGPIIGSGALAWMAIAEHHPQRLTPLLAGIFLLWQFLAFNGLMIAAPNVSGFEPSSLARFPVPFGRYLVLRTFLGLVTPVTVVGCVSLLAAAIGIALADAALALPAFIVLTVYGWMNVFFTRMFAAWLERLLAGRRNREIVGGLTTILFVGLQFFSMSGATNAQAAKGGWFQRIVYGSSLYLHWLPPGFAANAILYKGRPLAELAQFLALLGCTLLFLALFAMRLHKQFLGEYLSDGSSGGRSASSAARLNRPSVADGLLATSIKVAPFFPPILTACLRKEWLNTNSSPGQFIALLAPLLFVLLLGKGIFARHPVFFLPGAIAYLLLGLLAGLYNIFGADGPGVQLYLLAPIRLRDVIVAKNIASTASIVFQVLPAWLLVLWLSSAPVPLYTQGATGFWLLFVVFGNLTLGSLRSIQAPRKVNPGQARTARAPADRTSSLLVLAGYFGSLFLQVPVTLLSRHFGLPWLGTLIFALLAVAAIIAYVIFVRHADQLILSYRDRIAEELCRS